MELQKLVELGVKGLAEENQWMLEVNLGNLVQGCTWEYETYWLMVIKTASKHYLIMSRTARQATR
jgi:hypothetical protein